MRKFTKVSWLINGQITRGLGVTCSDVDELGCVLVSVEHLAGEPNPGYHIVIRCTVTWLTIETT